MEQETRTPQNTNHPFFVAGTVFSAIIVAGLLIAGLLKWIAWPVVFYTLKSTLITSLIGMVGGSLLEARRKTKNRPLKALLILATLGCIVFFSGVFLVLDDAKPEMRHVEESIFSTLLTFAGFAGLSIFELGALLTGQPHEPPEDSRLEKTLKRMLKPLLEKLEKMQNFVMLGMGISLLLIALVVRTSNPDMSNSSALLAVEFSGLGGIVFGIADCTKTRFSHLAKGLSFLGSILMVVVAYFFIRWFIYG